MINSPSIINCNFLTLDKQLQELIEGGVEFFHIDIMDGHYVPNLSFPLKVISDIKDKYPNIITDIHLMVSNPEDYINDLKKSGADYVSFHIDSTNFIRRTISHIQANNMKAGIVINPSERVDLIEPFMDDLDYVVLMTVEPGYAGQRFLKGSLNRLNQLSKLRKEFNTDFLISIDGGVDYENGKECAKLGADILVTNVFTIFNQTEGIKNACYRFEREFKQF